MAYYEVTVGDEVAIIRRHRYGGILNSQFGHVVKINGHGHIYVDTGKGEPKRFDRYGYAYKDEFGPYLAKPAPIREELARMAKERQFSDLALQMKATLDSGFNYQGRFRADAASLQKLQDLLDEMKTMAEE